MYALKSRLEEAGLNPFYWQLQGELCIYFTLPVEGFGKKEAGSAMFLFCEQDLAEYKASAPHDSKRPITTGTRLYVRHPDDERLEEGMKVATQILDELRTYTDISEEAKRKMDEERAAREPQGKPLTKEEIRAQFEKLKRNAATSSQFVSDLIKEG